jgi:hypothetical protein
MAQPRSTRVGCFGTAMVALACAAIFLAPASASAFPQEGNQCSDDDMDASMMVESNQARRAVPIAGGQGGSQGRAKPRSDGYRRLGLLRGCQGWWLDRRLVSLPSVASGGVRAI